MFDLIKTFILGIWIEKKYRYFFLFILITLIYRFAMWLNVAMLYEILPVDFVKLNTDGSLTFIYAKRYEQTIYPYEYQLPTEFGRKNKNYDIENVKNTKQCEQKFFLLYKKALEGLLRSSADKKYILRYKQKFPNNKGEISYYDRDNVERYVFQTLYKQGFIFKKNKDIDYCNELKLKTSL